MIINRARSLFFITGRFSSINDFLSRIFCKDTFRFRNCYEMGWKFTTDYESFSLYTRN
jgi:hypothetical protein